MSNSGSEPGLTLRPIGYVRSGKQVKFQTLHQPAESAEERSLVELLPDQDYELALRDLVGFSRIWLVWWFHKNPNWRPLVLPPRGPAQRRGLFATRSPHRPNPLGLTPVKLLGIAKRTLIIGACDLMEGTPVFDIKPYIPAYDSFPESAAGWTDEVDDGFDGPPKFTVKLMPVALAQADWLRSKWSVEFTARLFELLSRDPSVHRGRRIRRRNESQLVIGCGAWQAIFRVTDVEVEIDSLEAAYPLRFLVDPSREGIPDQKAQLAFIRHWKQVKGVSDFPTFRAPNPKQRCDKNPLT